MNLCELTVQDAIVLGLIWLVAVAVASFISGFVYAAIMDMKNQNHRGNK
jgi:hypothetical protein